MRYKVLLIESNEKIRKKTKDQLERRGLSIIDAHYFNDGLKLLRQIGDIQIVLVNWKIQQSQDSAQEITGEKIFNEIIKRRPEVNIFLFTQEKDPRKIKGHGKISGYFFKMDFDYDDIKRKISAAIKEKSQTPFYDELVKYANKSNEMFFQRFLACVLL